VNAEPAVPVPGAVGIIDTMIGFPHGDVRAAYAEIRRQIRDRDTLDNTEMPVEYMFRYYPPAMIDYANTRGADRVIYGGYFPMGLSLERIMGEIADVAFKDDVWPKFLRDNAARVLKLDPS
jgi:hypothetical protein